MDALHHHAGRQPANTRIPLPAEAIRSGIRVGDSAGSLGVLNAHAIAIRQQAEQRYREMALHMSDCGRDELAMLFDHLAEQQGKHADQQTRYSVAIGTSPVSSAEYDWFFQGKASQDARQFIFSVMTPRLALETAIRAADGAREFFERVRRDSSSTRIRALAAELTRGQQAEVDSLRDALSRVPRAMRADGEATGDPTIEPQL